MVCHGHVGRRSAMVLAMEQPATSTQTRSGRRRTEGELAGLQRRQHGAFSRGQAIDVGLTADAVDGRFRHGRYRRLLPGVMAEAGVPDSFELRAMAALLWAGGDAVLARGSAARVHGLPLPAAATRQLHLLVANRCFSTPRGLVVHRTRHLDASDCTSVGALAVTTVTRTVCDLAGDLSPTALRRLVAAAARDGVTDDVRLRTALRRLGRIRGARHLRRIVDELSPLDAQCRSEFESVFLRMARRHGVEPTAMNHPIRDGDAGRRLLDAVYLPEHVWVELDSRRFHGTLLDRNDDAIRSAAIERGGAWADPLRFTWEDVTERSAEVVAQIRAALAAAEAVQ